MSKYQPKWAKKRDTAEGPIVEALEKAGYVVEKDGEVDLLVRHNTWTANLWQKLECKTPTKTGKRRKRKDQGDQDDYCALHGIPYVLTPEEALQILRASGARRTS